MKWIIEMKMVIILILLLLALFGAVWLLLRAATISADGVNELVQGIILTSITGLIASLAASFALVVKSIVDTEKDGGARRIVAGNPDGQ